ncbi:MAG: hypothetical protein R2865_11730 [Deinococcales bacterium]
MKGLGGLRIAEIYAENTGIYGLYPVQSTDVIIEDSVVVGS